jgi:hypothetical protein
MSTSAEYRKFARECLEWATEEKDEAKRQALIENANTWTLAALRLEEGSDKPAHIPPFMMRGETSGMANDEGA